jgi:phytoene dehydrogenase-like protein
MTWDAAVIGAGIGGLSCAGVLAARGARVLVLDQAASPGGYLASFRRGGFVFDAAVDCVAGLDSHGPLTWLLRSLGKDGDLSPVRLDPIRLSRFPGLSVPVDARLADYVERLSALFPAERKGIADFFLRAGRIYADVEGMMEPLVEGRDGPASIPSEILRYREATYGELLAEDLCDVRLKAILSDRCPFLGLPPRRVSAIGMVSLVMSYFRSGAWRPAGGHGRLAELLAEGIEERGGKVLLSRRVDGIALDGARRARVVTAGGEEFAARTVVSAVDPFQTFARLVGGAPGAAALAGLAGRNPSPSFFIVYVGAAGNPEGEDASSIGSFGSFDLDRLLDGYVPFSGADPLGITIPTVEDRSLAPPGHHVYLVHELVPRGCAIDWPARKPELVATMVEKAGRIVPGLEDRIVHCEGASPATLERYTGNRGGAAYGWEQLPALPRVRHGIPNLFMAGHWTETGGGVLAAACSGIRAAAGVLRELS